MWTDRRSREANAVVSSAKCPVQRMSMDMKLFTVLLTGNLQTVHGVRLGRRHEGYYSLSRQLSVGAPGGS